MTKPSYFNWENVPEGLHTKTQWDVNGYKLIEGATPVAQVDYLTRYGRKFTDLYDSQAVTEKRKIKRLQPQPLELTPETIGKCLHILNKAAKRRRDSSEKYSEMGRYDLASSCKTRKKNLYDLKDKVLSKAIAEGIAIFERYHSQDVVRYVKEKFYHEKGCECDYCEEYHDGMRDELGWEIEYRETKGKTYFSCYSIAIYRFHLPLSQKPSGDITDLGDWVSPATSMDRDVKFRDALATLEAYLDSPQRPSNTQLVDITD